MSRQIRLHDDSETAPALPGGNSEGGIDRQSGFVLAVGWLIALLVTLT